MSEEWRSRAACRGLGPELFYDDDPAAVAMAKVVCAGCPVRVVCAAEALAAGETVGVWGGLSPQERVRPVGLDGSRSGRRRVLTDDELRDVFACGGSGTAVAVLLGRVGLSRASAYRALGRAAQLGLVERRGRRLYPTWR